MKLSEYIPGLRRKLANRQDFTDVTGLVWLKATILEFSENYSFEELKVTGPTVQFIGGQSSYLPSFFTNDGEKATMIDVWFVQYDLGTGQGIVLKYRTPPVVEPMTKTNGLPTKWTRYGKELIVGQAPDKPYSTYQKYQRLHPFGINPAADDVMLPDSWQELVEFAAAERGAIELRMLDYASSYHNLLYGDPEFEKSGGTKGAPGLIFKRCSQYERDSSNNERQLKPVVIRTNP